MTDDDWATGLIRIVGNVGRKYAGRLARYPHLDPEGIGMEAALKAHHSFNPRVSGAYYEGWVYNAAANAIKNELIKAGGRYHKNPKVSQLSESSERFLTHSFSPLEGVVGQARGIYAVCCRTLPKYSGPYSPRRYTHRQVSAMALLRWHRKWSFRQLITNLRASPELREALELVRLPTHEAVFIHEVKHRKELFLLMKRINRGFAAYQLG